MRLANGMHLAYCTNAHRGESWAEVFATLREHAPAVRDRVCRPGEECGVGLRLGDRAVRELSVPATLARLRRWLERERCYVFTINGSSFGPPGQEAAGRPDWTRPERLAHTCRLLDLLGELLPDGAEGSVSTLPGSLKAFIEPGRMAGDLQAIYANLIHGAVHAAEVSGRTGRPLRLALEPEPLGLFENTAETIRFLEPLVEAFPDQFGVCFDACHFAVEFEEPAGALAALERAGIPVVKLRLGAALRTCDGAGARERLRSFADDPAPRPVAVRRDGGRPTLYRDLHEALATPVGEGDEWRVRLHVPLHDPGDGTLGTTDDGLPGVLDWLAADPARCPHLEVESPARGLLPAELETAGVVERLARESEWTLGLLRERGLA